MNAIIFHLSDPLAALIGTVWNVTPLGRCAWAYYDTQETMKVLRIAASLTMVDRDISAAACVGTIS